MTKCKLTHYRTSLGAEPEQLLIFGSSLTKDYENQWVAIDERSGVEFIVGHGRDAVEAAQDAEQKGIPKRDALQSPIF